MVISILNHILIYSTKTSKIIKQSKSLKLARPSIKLTSQWQGNNLNITKLIGLQIKLS